MQVKQLKAVLFDIGGVVITCDLERYVPMACALFNAKEDSLRREVDLHVRDLEKGIISSEQFWRMIEGNLYVKGEGRPAGDTRTSTIWREVLVQTLQVNKPMMRLCQVLSRRGIIVGALSNTIEDHVAVFEEQGIYIPFNPLVLSCRLGMRKPDEEIFRVGYRMAGVQAAECLFIDDVEDNLPPAQAVGLRTHHFNGSMTALLKNLVKLGLLENYDWYGPGTQEVGATGRPQTPAAVTNRG